MNRWEIKEAAEHRIWWKYAASYRRMNKNLRDQYRKR
jgi:hypothetical protein